MVRVGGVLNARRPSSPATGGSSRRRLQRGIGQGGGTVGLPPGGGEDRRRAGEGRPWQWRSGRPARRRWSRTGCRGTAPAPRPSPSASSPPRRGSRPRSTTTSRSAVLAMPRPQAVVLQALGRVRGVKGGSWRLVARGPPRWRRRGRQGAQLELEAYDRDAARRRRRAGAVALPEASDLEHRPAWGAAVVEGHVRQVGREDDGRGRTGKRPPGSVSSVAGISLTGHRTDGTGWWLHRRLRRYPGGGRSGPQPSGPDADRQDRREQREERAAGRAAAR